MKAHPCLCHKEKWVLENVMFIHLLRCYFAKIVIHWNVISSAEGGYGLISSFFFVKFVYTNIQNANACVLQQYILICMVLMQMYELQMMYLRNSKWESTTLGERWHFHYHSVNLWRLGSGMNEGLEYPHKSRCLASLSFSLSVWLRKRQNLF